MYGTKKSDQKLKGTVTQQEDGSYETVLPDLKLGTLYYFTIKAVTSDVLHGATYTGTLTTRGFPVQLTIKQNNLLQPGAKVKIDERSFTANKDALITTELSEGQHSAIITTDLGESATVTFTVAKKTISTSGSVATQNIDINATSIGTGSGTNSSFILFLSVGAAIIGVILAAIIGFIIYRRRKPQDETPVIDTDLLMASYGRDTNDYRSHTPQPNLDNMGLVQVATITPQVQQVEAQTAIPSQIDTDSQTQQDTAQMILPNDSIPQATITPENTTALPLPPSSEIPIDQQPQLEPVLTLQEEEQFSPALNQIEATEPIPKSEPSAVYHESTGELEIVHHHVSHQPTASNIPPSTPYNDPPVDQPPVSVPQLEPPISVPSIPSPQVSQGTSNS